MASTPTPKPIPDGYRRITPTLVVVGGARTADERALQLTDNPAERALLQHRIEWAWPNPSRARWPMPTPGLRLPAAGVRGPSS